MIKLEFYDDGKCKHQSHEVTITEKFFYDKEHEVYSHNPFDIIGYGETKDEALNNFKDKFYFVIDELKQFEYSALRRNKDSINDHIENTPGTINEAENKAYDLGFGNGYMKAEKDYFDLTEEYRQKAYDCGSIDGIKECLEIVQQLKDEYNDSKFDNPTPINYGTICGIIIKFNQMITDIKDNYDNSNKQKIHENTPLNEKSIPKEPKYTETMCVKRWDCPNCDKNIYFIQYNTLISGGKFDYCPYCAQKIDWRYKKR